MQPIRIILTGLIALTLLQCGKEPSAPQTSGEVTIEITGKTLTGTIVSGETLLEMMDRLKAAGHIQFEASGTGEMTMIDSLNGQKNEGAGDTRRNWLYAHNGKLSPVGIGQLKLNPGDRIVWCFVLWQDRESCK